MYNFDNSDDIPEFGEEVRDAIDNGDVVGLRKALDKGAHINMKFGRYKATPIHFASKKQSLEIVEELVKRGADINGTDGINDRPLHEAVRFGSQSILTFLLKKNADPDVQNDYEDTPLLYCFDTTKFRINGWTKKAQVLLKHGARKEVENMHSKKAVQHLQTFLQVVRNGKNIEKEIRNSEELAEAYHLYDVLTEVNDWYIKPTIPDNLDR
ncbi:ankyrin repeat-containing protein DDB_G0279043-like [Pecten maximus]|uniref:ankyrin repeat-containing protein DDB_G0279043-like n=1 Tax=Pecten maximus TaxID=6579 RepID=UPI0014587EDA|nr:ankyrin repeat-containing protein DDB_G0279043-like [Pecten maximus]